jgi:hypothetical protein
MVAAAKVAMPGSICCMVAAREGMHRLDRGPVLGDPLEVVVRLRPVLEGTARPRILPAKSAARN